jgi:hypothetical protein
MMLYLGTYSSFWEKGSQTKDTKNQQLILKWRVAQFRLSYNGCLKGKARRYKVIDCCTISLNTHTAKIVAAVLGRRIENKIENVLERDQFEFRGGKETGGASKMLQIISKRTSDVEEELCACFIDWQMAFVLVN